MSSIERILVPVDFSETSDRALAQAMALAPRLGATVHLVHVWDLPAYTLPDGSVFYALEAATEVERGLQKSLDERISRFGGHEVAITGSLRRGAPHHEIVEAAKEQRADLIVIGTHGRTGIARLLIGSVAERVVRTSPVPVLTVPPTR